MRWRGNPRGVIASTLFILLAPPFSPAQDTVTVDADSVVQYILSCRKPNGAFGPIDQYYTDAAWNYPAVASLELLGHEIEKPEAILENGMGYPEGHAGYGHWLFFHQHRIRQLLGDQMEVKHEVVRLVHQGFEVRYYGSPFGTDGDTFFKAGGGHPDLDRRDFGGEEFGYYNLSSLYYLLTGLEASGRAPLNPDELIKYVRARQAPNGGFVDVRTESGVPIGDEAHVVHTFHALKILRMLGSGPPDPIACAKFIHACQNRSGGVRWHPNAEKPENVADIYYLWAAVKALELLGEKPAKLPGCRTWIRYLQNPDGGFGDRMGMRSRLYSTYYAIDSLSNLTGGNPAEAIKPRNLPRFSPSPNPFSAERFQVYQALFKMPIIEAGDLKGLYSSGFNLLALKSDDFSLMDSLRAAIREYELPMDVVLCPEAYPHRARRHGGVLLHHICNPILDPFWRSDQRSRWKSIDMAGAKGLNWKNYLEQVVEPLRFLNSIVYPEQDFEMEYAYSAYDVAFPRADGYEAVLVGFNWAPRDFVRVFPWRERYVNLLVPIADCDAHGDLEKWSPQLDHTRNLFIAEGPTYHDFLEASMDGRVVCVIRNTEAGSPPATFYGSAAAVNYVKERMDEWKWW